ncbi:MAG: thioredoxin family protein [Candidatus Shapirobacteria bacterium]|nr:thioredoxin family protein [Candidatus Shapirobacteria bacterium]
MKIQLFDRGTPQGKQLFSNIEEVCKRLQIDYDPEYVKDMSRVINMGLQGKTILLINGEIAFMDKYPSVRELETIISDFQK